MKKAVIVYIILLLGICLTISCKKENEDDLKEFVEAQIIDGGAVEVDGCGWLVGIGDVNYHPVNLPENFREDELKVKIKYREDPTVFLCGLAGNQIPSIFIEDIVLAIQEVIIADDNNLPPVGDGFFIDTAYINGDLLVMEIGYSGGCETHEFAMYSLTTNPDLMLYHNANNDACEAYLHEKLLFDLKPIRVPGTNSVTFNLRQAPVMSSYYGIYTYYY